MENSLVTIYVKLSTKATIVRIKKDSKVRDLFSKLRKYLEGEPSERDVAIWLGDELVSDLDRSIGDFTKSPILKGEVVVRSSVLKKIDPKIDFNIPNIQNFKQFDYNFDSKQNFQDSLKEISNEATDLLKFQTADIFKSDQSVKKEPMTTEVAVKRYEAAHSQLLKSIELSNKLNQLTSRFLNDPQPYSFPSRDSNSNVDENSNENSPERIELRFRYRRRGILRNNNENANPVVIDIRRRDTEHANNNVNPAVQRERQANREPARPEDRPAPQQENHANGGNNQQNGQPLRLINISLLLRIALFVYIFDADAFDVSHPSFWRAISFAAVYYAYEVGIFNRFTGMDFSFANVMNTLTSHHYTRIPRYSPTDISNIHPVTRVAGDFFCFIKAFFLSMVPSWQVREQVREVTVEN